MPADFEVGTAALERLSALVDGELDADAVAHACARWRESEAQRASWHAYQLIGDVLRSDDLAGDPARDAHFMSGLRARLAMEPVVLAPQAREAQPADVALSRQVARSAPARRWAWLAPSAVAAGFVAVAGALMVARAPDGGAPSGVPMASAELVNRAPAALADGSAIARQRPQADDIRRPPPEGVDETSGGRAFPQEPQVLVANGALIRDARLDRYLAAHKQFAGTSALGVPSGFLRSVTVSGSDR